MTEQAARFPLDPSALRKVVVVRASRIGDFVCAYPALRALRAGLPHAEISLITLPMLAGLVQRLPYVDRMIEFPGFPGIASQLFEARKAHQFFTNMLTEEFDLAIQMHGTGVYANPFTLLLGARHTVGFIRPGDPPDRLDGALPFPARGHEVERLLALVKSLGLPAADKRPAFPLWEQDHAAAEALLHAAPRPLIGLHPAAHSLTRRWPPERFTAAAQRLLERHGGTVVLLAGPGEVELAGQIAASIGPACLNLAGKTSLPELGAVITRLSVLLTNDSGPAHIAYALGTPTVTVWGGEDLERYGPPRPGPFTVLVHPIACRPCGLAECPIGYACLDAISVETAVAACEAYL